MGLTSSNKYVLEYISTAEVIVKLKVLVAIQIFTSKCGLSNLKIPTGQLKFLPNWKNPIWNIPVVTIFWLHQRLIIKVRETHPKGLAKSY